MPCPRWPCNLCLLGVQHSAGLVEVEAALIIVRAQYMESKVTRYQLEMAEAAAMQAVSDIEKDMERQGGYEAVRRYVIDRFARPYSAFPSSSSTSRTSTTVRPSQGPIPGPPSSAPPRPPPPPLVPPPSFAGKAQSSSSTPVAAPTAAPMAKQSEAANTAASAAPQRPLEYKWQVKTGKANKRKWTDALPALNERLEAAYTQGFCSTTWDWDGWTYYYEFGNEMMQTSPGEEGTERPIRRILKEPDE